MNQTDILRKRLSDKTKPGLWCLIPLAIMVCFALFYGASCIQSGEMPSEEKYTFFINGMQCLLLLQGIVLVWVGIWRWIKPEHNRLAGEVFSYCNILLLGLCLFLAIKIHIFQTPVLACLLLLLYLFAILQIVRLHRLVRALYNPHTKKAREQASPCPLLFHLLDFHKSMACLPFLFGAFCYGFFKLITGGGTAWGAFLVGFAVTTPIVLLYSPASFLIKQTATPSTFQRIIRKAAIFTWQFQRFPYHELPAFYWWLSHPGWNWPENFEELAPLIDTDSFNWQNPKEWQEPLHHAQARLAARRLPPLIPGSRANELEEVPQTAQLRPTQKLTPFLSAVIHHDIQELKKLLPSVEINRAYANNGNTPLHIAAWNGYTDIAQLLLTQPGIDKNAQNLAGKTPLDLAKEQNYIEIVALLEK